MGLAELIIGVLGIMFTAAGVAYIFLVLGAYHMATTWSEPDWTDFLPAAFAIGAGVAFILIGF